MTQYLLAIHRHRGYDPAVSEDDAMGHEIDALNDEMKASGVRVFVGGLAPIKSAKAIRISTDRVPSVTDGPYLESKEFVGGFWVLEAATLDDALEWGRKAAVACRAAVEVRAFL
jgi:hypothetical protein